MKLSIARARLELKTTFRIARSADDYRETVILRLEDEGLAGLGEAAPISRYDQTPETAQSALEGLADTFPDDVAGIGLEGLIFRAAKRLGKEKAALAAFDIALHDLMGKRRKAPLYDILGLNPDRTPVTTFTIAIDTPENIERKVHEAADFPVLKIKLGLGNDREIIETIRRTTDRPLRVDANEAWDREEALEIISWLADRNVELVEQPLPAGRLDDMRWLAERSPLPLFADESVLLRDSIPPLAGAFDGVNIKLMKCGGIHEALGMIDTARRHDLEIMLGCMIESSIGITAAAQISPLVDYADLDGNILIRNDPAEGVTVENGKLVLPSGPGLSVTLRDGPVRDTLEGAA
jgi:L-alanine-DL-glutamate epimerase-like enolase superfamily enzyme